MVSKFARLALFTLLFIALQMNGADSQGSSTVYVVDFNGTINPASADYIHGALDRATESHAQCVVIRLNTPGGLLASTRVIVSDFLTSSVPVVVYVSPSGSQAASAGVFITLAAHIAAMAPGTNIGAAHPVTLEQQMDSVMMEKATNDAAAFIRSISQKRHRNVEWAEDAVRKSLSITETEALQEGIIDTVATSLQDLLVKIDGMTVETSDGNKTLATKNAEIVTVDQSVREKLLDLLSDPNVSYILMMLGIWGLIFELYNPGLIFPGIVGFISLVLAFYSFNTLPVNYAGLALIVFGIVLFILEIKLTSHGLLTAGGIASIFFGSLMLIKVTSPLEGVSISMKVIVSVLVCTAGFFLFIIGAGIRAQRRKPTTGKQGLIGEIGEAASDLSPSGQVKVHGETWNATTIEGTISLGSKVQIVEVLNLHLKVKQAPTL
jgi:membrane-bound serine protease (ClpP class)